MFGSIVLMTKWQRNKFTSSQKFNGQEYTFPLKIFFPFWLIKWEQFSLSTTQLPIIILENGLTIFQDWEFCFFLHFRPCEATFIPKNASILEHKGVGVGFKFLFGLCPFESGIFLVQAFLNSIIGQSDLIWSNWFVIHLSYN